MVAAEEERIKERTEAVKAREESEKKASKNAKSHTDPTHGEVKPNVKAP